VDFSRRQHGNAKSAPRCNALTREVFGWRVSSAVDARAKDESMRAACEPTVARFERDVCCTISAVLSHCLDTSPAWTGARRINARQRWDNVDARPGETAGPSVGKVLPDEIIDGLW